MAEPPSTGEPVERPGHDEEITAATQVVCPRCGIVQLRAVSCRICASPLGGYAAPRGGLVERMRSEILALTERGLLWPMVGGVAAVVALLAVLVMAVTGDTQPGPELVQPYPLPGERSATTGSEEVTISDLEAPTDPRAEALLDNRAPAEDEAPYVAVVRIRSGVHGSLHSRAYWNKTLAKKRLAWIEAALPSGWVLHVSGPQVVRLRPGQHRTVTPGRYELAAERLAAPGHEGQQLYLDLGLSAGRKYLVADRPIKSLKRLKKKGKR